MSDDSEYLEGLWDCPYGHKGQSGTKYSCTNCGAPRPENVEFYLPDDARVITDKKVITEAQAGSDLTCDSCGSSVLAGQTVCPQCSAPLDAAKRWTEKSKPTKTEPVSSKALSEDPAAPPRPGILIGMGIVGTLILLVSLGWWIFAPHQTTLRIVRTSWERTVALQEERTVAEEDWSVPAGGRTTSTYSAIHHYDDVVVGHRDVACHPSGHREKVGVRHTKCHSSDRVKTGSHRESSTTSLGNGKYRRDYYTVDDYSNVTCTHDCPEDVYETKRCTHVCQKPITVPTPVNRTKYRYDIERWFDLSPRTQNGTNGEPQWPVVTLDAKHRESGRQEKLTVIFTDPKGKAITMNPDSAYWSSLRPDMHCTGMVSRAGIVSGLPVCK